ncbi:zinc ribbon domain-containing protein [Microbacterium sp. BWT-B31]|uniref:Zn-ribbon domain-containing OB-fold protein n=1 Tax=Microbacterium sp. BWT-B31 TaxID=3232072 RepID=UPI0035275A92
MTLDRFLDTDPRPAPLVHPDTAPFWEALAAGELLLQRCASCDTARYPHAPVCYACGSFEQRWAPAAGPAGTVAVVARVHRATGERVWQAYAPYYSGLVDIEEDLRLPARILCKCDAITTPGTPVRAIALESADGDVVLGFAHSCVTP